LPIGGMRFRGYRRMPDMRLETVAHVKNPAIAAFLPRRQCRWKTNRNKGVVVVGANWQIPLRGKPLRRRRGSPALA
jgi:hypothetical protein